jgi:hypothetical protein
VAGQHTLDYLAAIEGETLPPLLLEVLLQCGRSFFLKSVFRPSRDTEMIVLRVWDLRAVNLVGLTARLNEVLDRADWERFAEIDPALDQANLWVRVEQIAGFVEWHERYWPVEAAERGAGRIGFWQDTVP